MQLIWPLIRLMFFRMDPEKAHYFAMDLLANGLKIPLISFLIRKSFQIHLHERYSHIVAGLHFKHRIGLAAGFDKDGKWLELLALLGFSFIEVGTVTPVAQSGNEKPRLFRLIKDRAIINRMGFNNLGVDHLVRQLKLFKKPKNLIIGGNIGKNKWTSTENAAQDYLICFEKLFDHVDYFVINVSSPNTPNLRQLQDKSLLSELLQTIQTSNFSKNYPKPVFLKIAPDLSDEAIEEIVPLVLKQKLTGIIATNTTIDRPENLIEKKLASESGGLSGSPLKSKSLYVLKKIKSISSELVVISSGGIETEEDVKERIQAGADLVQIYSTMIYQGPWICKSMINKDLLQ
ncbi:MAG: quinone-dependent dihydroorotate dehydrogenase [Saprospiraceae bacterium]|nr:quinone-dependent dihydroorotate dehydrogenase [Saprospiraceae bacterium]